MDSVPPFKTKLCLLSNCKLLSAEHSLGWNPDLIVFTAFQLEGCGTNLPYLTGGYSSQPGCHIAMTATSVAVCAGTGTAEDSCLLTCISCSQRNHLFPVLYTTSCLVRITLLEEGTTPLGEEELFFSRDGGCCSRKRQMTQRSEGILNTMWCI